MKKYFVLALLLAASCSLFAQANLIFSISQSYEFTVQVADFNFHRPQTWQIKYENIPSGNYTVIVTVTKPNSSFSVTRKFNLSVASGYESTYFVVPYENDLSFHLSGYYTLQQIYGKDHRNESRSQESERLTVYKGKKVLVRKDLEAFFYALKNQYSIDAQLNFLKSEVPLFAFYTDDLVYLLNAVGADSLKLELAKLAYDNCIDPEQYFKFGKSLDGNSYRLLTDFLRTKRQ